MCRILFLVGFCERFILLWGSEALTMEHVMKLMKGALPLRRQFVDWTSVQSLSTIPFPYTILLGDRVVLGFIGFCLVISQLSQGKWCYKANLASVLWLPPMQWCTEALNSRVVPQYYGKRKRARFFMEGEKGVNNDHVRSRARLDFKTRACIA